MAGSSDVDPAGNIAVLGAASFDSESLGRLRESTDPRIFAAIWLEIQSQIIGNALKGIVVLGPPGKGPFVPIASWPKGSQGSPGIIKATESAIAEKRLVVEKGDAGSAGEERSQDTVACPLIIDNKICGAAVLEVAHGSESDLKQIATQLEWGCSWLENLVKRNPSTTTDRLITIIELVATSLHYDRFQAAATAVATELASDLGCERVSIGYLKGKHTKLRALSHSASFGKKANLVRDIEASMDEAVDQQATIVYPATGEGPLQVTKAHEELQNNHSAGTICTVPLANGDQLLGAMTMELPEGSSFESRTVQLCEHAASIVGPLLDVKRKDDRWLIQKTFDSLSLHTKMLLGPRRTGLKLSVIGVIAVVAFFIFAKGDYRVTADATLEGTVQRAISAPMSGYVSEAPVRAGDIVAEGDLLFALDERDLRLERLKWVSQKSQRKREYSEALAGHERAQVRILGAQIKQADAQIALLDEQLARTKINSPFNGIVVAGDLSQSLGAPVERGDAMFEVAPLNSYRVILEVNERDIGSVEVGQTGQLALAGMPDENYPVMVEKITPISTAEEGENFFRVEAGLQDEALQKLRPGMEGVGKINIDERKLIWIWTHKITHWFRMFFWSWWP